MNTAPCLYCNKEIPAYDTFCSNECHHCYQNEMDAYYCTSEWEND